MPKRASSLQLRFALRKISTGARGIYCRPCEGGEGTTQHGAEPVHDIMRGLGWVDLTGFEKRPGCPKRWVHSRARLAVKDAAVPNNCGHKRLLDVIHLANGSRAEYEYAHQQDERSNALIDQSFKHSETTLALAKSKGWPANLHIVHTGDTLDDWEGEYAAGHLGCYSEHPLLSCDLLPHKHGCSHGRVDVWTSTSVVSNLRTYEQDPDTVEG
jgi:hypothetical protein